MRRSSHRVCCGITNQLVKLLVCLEEGSEKRSRNRFFCWDGTLGASWWLWKQLVKLFGVGVTVEVRLQGLDLDLLRSDE
jgi:hypothetical protein